MHAFSLRSSTLCSPSHHVLLAAERQAVQASHSLLQTCRGELHACSCSQSTVPLPHSDFPSTNFPFLCHSHPLQAPLVHMSASQSKHVCANLCFAPPPSPPAPPRAFSRAPLIPNPGALLQNDQLGYWNTLWVMLLDIYVVLTGPERRAVRMALWLAFFDQGCASTAIINYAPQVLERAGVTDYGDATLWSSAITAAKVCQERMYPCLQVGFEIQSGNPQHVIYLPCTHLGLL